MTFKKQDHPLHEAKKKKKGKVRKEKYLSKSMVGHKYLVNVRNVFSLDKVLTCFFSIRNIINRLLLKICDQVL